MQNQHFEHHNYIGGFPTGIALSFLVIYGFSYGAEIFPVDMFIKPLEHGLFFDGVFPATLAHPKSLFDPFFSLHIVNTNYLTNPSESQLIEVPI
jgi:hypothetical protein